MCVFVCKDDLYDSMACLSLQMLDKLMAHEHDRPRVQKYIKRSKKQAGELAAGREPCTLRCRSDEKRSLGNRVFYYPDESRLTSK